MFQCHSSKQLLEFIGMVISDGFSVRLVMRDSKRQPTLRIDSPLGIEYKRRLDNATDIDDKIHILSNFTKGPGRSYMNGIANAAVRRSLEEESTTTTKMTKIMIAMMVRRRQQRH